MVSSTQTAGQGHFQKITCRMSGERDLQVEIDLIGQVAPGTAMNSPTFLCRHEVAGEFCLGLVALQNQILGGCLDQPREVDVKAAGPAAAWQCALIHGSAQ